MSQGGTWALLCRSVDSTGGRMTWKDAVGTKMSFTE